MKDYPEHAELTKGVNSLKILKENLRNKVIDDILNMKLNIDKFVANVFAVNEIITLNDEIFAKARRRNLLRNPPGKNDSIGDAINWEIMLSNMPKGEDLHIISSDGDFQSKLDENKLNSYLEYEWKEKKISQVYFYKNLSDFTVKHFNGISFSFDTAKLRLLESLLDSPTFRVTHSIISELDKYEYYSLNEVETVLNACVNNKQVRWILDDKDVYEFVDRISRTKKSDIRNQAYLEIINQVKEYCTK